MLNERIVIEDIYAYCVDSSGDSFVAVDNHTGWLVIYRNGIEVGMRLIRTVNLG